MTRLQSLVTLGCMLFGTGCDEGVTCPAGSFPAVSAHVTSASDGSPLLGALGEVRDGEYRDSLFELGNGDYVAAYDRPGTYGVHIELQGYAAWDTAGVSVSGTGGVCSMVETEHVEAQLMPL